MSFNKEQKELQLQKLREQLRNINQIDNEEAEKLCNTLIDELKSNGVNKVSDLKNIAKQQAQKADIIAKNEEQDDVIKTQFKQIGLMAKSMVIMQVVMRAFALAVNAITATARKVAEQMAVLGYTNIAAVIGVAGVCFLLYKFFSKKIMSNKQNPKECFYNLYSNLLTDSEIYNIFEINDMLKEEDNTSEPTLNIFGPGSPAPKYNPSPEASNVTQLKIPTNTPTNTSNNVPQQFGIYDNILSFLSNTLKSTSSIISALSPLIWVVGIGALIWLLAKKLKERKER